MRKRELIVQGLVSVWIGMEINFGQTRFSEWCSEQEQGGSERKEIYELGCTRRRRKRAGSVQTVSFCGVTGGPGGRESGRRSGAKEDGSVGRMCI